MIELELFIQQLTRVQVKRAQLEITRYLVKSQKKRIQSQKNTDGTGYKKRKDGTKKTMLKGFKRNIKQRVYSDRLEIGIFGKSAKLATVHDQGEDEKGIKYPARNIIGLTAEDENEIRQILLKILNAGH